MSSYDEAYDEAYDEGYDEPKEGEDGSAPPEEAPPTNFVLPFAIERIIVEVGLKQALEEGTLQEFHEIVCVAHDTEGRQLATVDSQRRRTYDNGAVTHPKSLVAPGEEDELTWEGVQVDLGKLGSEVESLAFLLASYQPPPEDGEAGLGAQVLYGRILDHSDVNAAYETLPVLHEFTTALEEEHRGTLVLHLTRVPPPGSVLLRTVVEGDDDADSLGSEPPVEPKRGSTASLRSVGSATGAAPTAGGLLALPGTGGDGAAGSSAAGSSAAGSSAAGSVSAATPEPPAAAAAVGNWQFDFLARALASDAEASVDVLGDLVAETEAAVAERQAGRALRSVSLVALRPVRLPRSPELLSVEVKWSVQHPERHPLFPEVPDPAAAAAAAGAAGSDYSDKVSGAGSDGGYEDEDADAAAAKAAELATVEAALRENVQVVAVTTDAQGRPLEVLPFGVKPGEEDAVSHKPSRRTADGSFISTVQCDLTRLPADAVSVSFLLVDLKDALGDLAAITTRLLDVTGLDLDAILAPPPAAEAEAAGDEDSESSSQRQIHKSGSKVSKDSGGSSRKGSDRSERSSDTLRSAANAAAASSGPRRAASELPAPARGSGSSTVGSKKGLSKSVSATRGAAPVVTAPEPEPPVRELPPEPANVGKELAKFELLRLDPTAAPKGVALPATPPMSPRGGESAAATAAAAAAAGALANAPSLACAQLLARIDRTPAVLSAAGEVVTESSWSILPLGERLQCQRDLKAVAVALERAIQEQIPRFALDLHVDKPFRLKDYKEGWDYTNVVLGLSWSDDNGPIMDLPLHAGAMLMDERGTELATISIDRKESVDGAVVHYVTEELRAQEALLRSQAAAAAAARKREDGDESASESAADYSLSGDGGGGGRGGRGGVDGGEGDEAGLLGALSTDPDLEKLAVDLTKLSDKVKAVIVVLGSTDPEVVVPGAELLLRVVDQTKSLVDGKPESIGVGFEAARYQMALEEGHTSIVVAVLAHVPETGKWRLVPSQQYYDGLSFADVLVDIETNFRASVPAPPLVIPETVRTEVPRELVPMAAFDGRPMERTLAMVKPDALSHVSPIIRDIAIHGFTILKRSTMRLTLSQAAAFYAEHREKGFYNGLVSMMASGPIEVLVLGRSGAIEAWRTLLMARIRPRYGLDATRNAVHGSSDPASAMREIRFFFPEMVVGVVEAAKGLEKLEAEVNATLLKGLTALAKAKPEDPVRWLGRWLLENNGNRPGVSEAP